VFRTGRKDDGERPAAVSATAILGALAFVVIALIWWISDHFDSFWEFVYVAVVISARVIFWLAVVIIGIYCLTRLL
jgi:apolipoprotein N-acyltransferase